MRLLRSRHAASLLLALAFAVRVGAATTVPDVPNLVTRDLSKPFPDTSVGQTSTLSCFGLCFRQTTSPQGACDGSGTESLEKAVAPPFSVGNFRRGSSSQCGGTPVTLPVSIGPGQALWFDAEFSPTRPGSFSDSLRISGFNLFFSGSTGTVSPCIPDATTLCVNGNRFAVTASWTTTDGHTGAGQAVPLTADTGYFWFFSDANVEMVLKILDACSFNQRFWLFAGGLTDVKVDITVRDTATGAVKTYHNPQGTAFRPIQDTSAFANCPGPANAPQSVGTPTGTVLAVDHGRFRVTTNWRTANGQSGSGQAVQLSDETGYFWFFSPDNVEMLLKILDACSFNQRFWVYAGGLTNVQVDITVLDTTTQAVKTYHNPQGTPFQPIQDTSAFSTCSTSGLPPDPGDAGKLTLAGIDSDHDGIRDDLQRHIALSYGGSPATVDALRQTAKVVQGAILDNASSNISINHATDLARALECLEAARPNDAATVHQTLISQALNTEARGLAFLAFNDRLGGAVFPLAPVAEWASSCDAATAADFRALGRPERRAATQSCQHKATVFFGNGVWNSCPDAQVSADALAAAVQPLLTADERSSVSFALACNPTQGKIADAWRVTKQYFVGNFTAFYSALVGIALTPNPLVQELLAEALVLDANSVIDDSTLHAHVNKYQSLLLEGQKVIVTSHSQGNFYSNFASRELTDEQRLSFGIVAVATPADHVEESWDYTTLKNDKIIGYVPFALPWNVDNGAQAATDSTGHQFVISYLAPGTSSRSRIINQVVNELRTLPSPSNSAGDGIITVTLTWDGETDVDLHVFEPGGTHVYYNNLSGDSGYLDIDNTFGFGPEHYYVGCNTVQNGIYHVGVNYYSGDAPETAHIQISAGLVSRSFNIRLPVALGVNGNDSPQPIADIVVGGSAERGYTFDVQPKF